MEAENTKNGWEPISRDQALSTKRQPLTAPTRTAWRSAQIAPSWRESRLSSQKQNSTNDFGWKSQIRLFTSRIAVQQAQSQVRPTNSGTARHRICLISKSSDQPRISMFQRKGARSSTPIRTRES